MRGWLFDGLWILAWLIIDNAFSGAQWFRYVSEGAFGGWLVGRVVFFLAWRGVRIPSSTSDGAACTVPPLGAKVYKAKVEEKTNG